MDWKVSLFAHLRDRYGDSVNVEAAPVAAALLQALFDSGVDTTNCRLAVNDAFADPETPLQQGDSISLIPPVSGG